MDDAVYRLLRNLAIVLTIAWVGWSAWDYFHQDTGPGMVEYAAGNRAFEDGDYERALQEYTAALKANPQLLDALRGKARTLMQLGRNDEALAAFNEAIARDPEFGGTYANRGILHDRMGHYTRALADYEKALALDPELAEGPGWMTRFLRLQPEKPPTIADRARYLREQLALPPDQRLLRVPEEDAKQRGYKK